jgi:L-lactate dehydrogenase
LRDYCAPVGEYPDFDDFLRQVRRAAPEIVRHKGYTSFAIASCVTRICEAILRDEHTVLPISIMLKGQYGINNFT